MILELPHPFGPVLGPGPASGGPWAVVVEFLMPLDRPDLLDANLAHGPIEKQHVDPALVPVDGDA